MSFSIVLGTNKSELNKVKKDIDVIATVTGTLREETSIIDPTFLVSDVAFEQIANCNYCEVDTFKRKYFVKEIVSIRNNLWSISCHVDVLSTYSTEILEQNAIILRQANDWNMYLDDGIFKTYQNPNIITKAFPSGFNSQNFVMAIAGG